MEGRDGTHNIFSPSPFVTVRPVPPPNGILGVSELGSRRPPLWSWRPSAQTPPLALGVDPHLHSSSGAPGGFWGAAAPARPQGIPKMSQGEECPPACSVVHRVRRREASSEMGTRETGSRWPRLGGRKDSHCAPGHGSVNLEACECIRDRGNKISAENFARCVRCRGTRKPGCMAQERPEPL